MQTTQDVFLILKVLIRCHSEMRALFRLPAILRSEKLPSDLASGPEFDKLVRICLDLSGMPFTDDKKDLYECDELLDFASYWCSDRISKRLAKFSAEKSENGHHFLVEFKKLLRMTADLLEEVNDFEKIKCNDTDNEVHELRRQLLQIDSVSRKEIAQLISESTNKMEQIHSDYGAKEEKLQPMIGELTQQLENCETAYKSEIQNNQEEVNKETKHLRAAIDNYDRGMSPVYRKLLQLNEKIRKQQQINDELNARLAEQAVSYNAVLEEQKRIWDEKLRSFTENRSAKIIQRAYREFRLKKQKKLRKMKQKGRKGKK